MIKSLTRFPHRLAFAASVLAFVVVVLGAYTRLTNAGLGCPDWPGCYGQITAPHTQSAKAKALARYPAQKIETTKAWTEMVHRYVAGVLGLLILGFCFLLIRNRNTTHQPPLIPFALLALLALQVLLGAWTVTLRVYPLVVSSHLVTGMMLCALLWWQGLALRGTWNHTHDRLYLKLKPWSKVALGFLLFQIALGAWTSANYAGIICPDFPYCQGKLLPPMNFEAAFNLFMPLGANYEGGLLGNAARVAIQMVHRFGALITFFLVGGVGLASVLRSRIASLRKVGWAVITCLTIQITLGILSAVWLLPLPIADAHNGFALLLLLSMVTLTYHVHREPIV